MLSIILKSFRKNPSLTTLHDVLMNQGSVNVCGLGESSAAFAVSTLLGESAGGPERSILALLPDVEGAETFRGDVEDILGSGSVKYFPERDTSFYEEADSHFEVRSQRVETLDHIERGWKGIIVAPISALHDPTTPPGLIELVSVEVKQGAQLVFDNFVRSMVAKGFKRQNSVTSAGEIAVRGGIVDIFPFGGNIPYRIEFWGDEIESIRTFSTSNQRSLNAVDGFRILPPMNLLRKRESTKPMKSG